MVVLTAVLSSVGGQEVEVDPAALAKELPRSPPRSPAEALAGFRLDERLRIELVAAEPDVVDPVAMVFDEDGRMLVVEMRDYPFEPGKGQSPEQDASAHPGRVRLLEDLDGDGRADKSTVFADGLSWPTGILPWKGGAFVTAAPDILYLRDEDRDGIADRREKVWSGFSRENVQGLLNNLRWGLDNRIYGSSGSNGGSITSGRDPSLRPVSLRGRDFRFDPREGALEPIPGGGQFGMCFDDWGERFACSNSNHIRHVVLDGSYLDRNPFLAVSRTVNDIAIDGNAAPVFRTSSPEPWRLVRTRWRAASAERFRYATTELVPIGFFTSATGILIYRGDALPPEFRGNAFIGDVGGNLVHRKVLEQRGVTFVARRDAAEAAREFLTSTDNWFRPVSLAEGPDGALYILDMYRETIEHPASIPESIKRFVDLKSGDDRGRIYRIVPKSLAARPPPPKLSAASELELVRRLESDGSWWRETSQRLLVERLGGGKGFAAAPGAASGAVGELWSLVKNGKSPLARLHALWTLDGLGALSPQHVEAALGDARGGVRRSAVRLAERFAQASPGLTSRLLSLADDVEVPVRFQLAFALGTVHGPEAVAALSRVAAAEPSDPWVRAAVLSSTGPDASRVEPLLLSLVRDAVFASRPGGSDLLDELAALIGARNDVKATGRVLAMAAVAIDENRPVQAVNLVAGLGDGLRRAGASLSALMESPPPELQREASAMASVFRTAAARATDRKLAEKERLSWVRLLASAPFPLAEGALAPLLDVREPQAIQLAGVRALASFASPKVAIHLVERWKELSPPVRREAAEALFGRRERLDALLDGIERGAVSAFELDLGRKKALLEHQDPALRRRALALIGAAGQAGGGERKAVVDSYREALHLKGDVDRGKQVFRRLCATCHRLDGEGLAVAPDFATLRERNPESVLEHILDPNREVLPEYIAYAAIMADGRVLTGMIAAETGESITLRRAEGVEETILRRQLTRLESTGASLMPEGLEKDLSLQDAADLIAAIRKGDS